MLFHFLACEEMILPCPFSLLHQAVLHTHSFSYSELALQRLGVGLAKCLEINRQVILATQAKLTLCAQHCIPLGWKSSSIPS